MTTAQVMDEAAIVPNRAAGYRLDQGVLKNQHWVSPSLNTTADGALYVSINDMVAWDRALQRRSILKEAELGEAWKPASLNDGSTRPYGLGWALAEENGNRIVEHSGHWQGFSSHILRYPDRGVSVILLSNLAEVPAGMLARSLAGLADRALAVPERRYVYLPNSLLREYVGRYALSPTLTLEISLTDGVLFGAVTGQKPLAMRPEAKDRFFVEEIPAPITFFRDSGGKITHLVLEQGGPHRANRLD
jgi:CubicO group peptidase (beta-lactamase class C family)